MPTYKPKKTITIEQHEGTVGDFVFVMDEQLSLDGKSVRMVVKNSRGRTIMSKTSLGDAPTIIINSQTVVTPFTVDDTLHKYGRHNVEYDIVNEAGDSILAIPGIFIINKQI